MDAGFAGGGAAFLMRTLRSKKLRWLLWQAQDGKCAICGCKLPNDWHADHIVPWSKSGRTNVHEMQATCPGCNLKKGVRMPDRMHQSLMRSKARELKSGIGRDVLAWVVPGGGKSRLPLILLEALPTHSLAWFVPRLLLRDQAERSAFEDFGIEIRGSGNDIDPCRGCRGFVATHDALTEHPSLWRDELRRKKYILVVDEIHHAKIYKSGPNALASVLATLPYSIRLLMTGTVDTNDNSYIYGLTYSDVGSGKQPQPEQSADHYIRYDRQAAISEQAVVPVVFHYHDGDVDWEKIQTGDSDGCRVSSATREQESNAIFTFLNTGIADSLFNRCIDHYKTNNGGKLLVVCYSQTEARAYQSKLPPSIRSYLAITENKQSREHVEKFKQDTGPSALITCQMAYEGLDCPPISHIACLTHIRSVPWIEQMIARAWRTHPGKDLCHCFVPDDPRMNRVIKRIHDEQPSIVCQRDSIGGNGSDSKPLVDILPRSGMHTHTRRESLDGSHPKEIEPAYNANQQQVIDLMSSLGIGLSDSRLASILQDLADEPASQHMTPSQEEKFLRNAIADRCRAHDYSVGNDPGTAQKRLMRHTRKSITKMTREELRRTHAIATQLFT